MDREKELHKRKSQPRWDSNLSTCISKELPAMASSSKGPTDCDGSRGLSHGLSTCRGNNNLCMPNINTKHRIPDNVEILEESMINPINIYTLHPVPR